VLSGATKDLLTKHPKVTMFEIMGAVEPSIKYHDIKLGLGGSCLDLHYFGRCNQAHCTYKHDIKAALPAARVRQVVSCRRLFGCELTGGGIRRAVPREYPTGMG
jgi:hypothetical protein